MGYRVSARPTPPRPDTTTPSYRRVCDLCWAGQLPAELLLTKDRERLVTDLWAAGWTDLEIAVHTRMTTYTTGRIRDRLGLAAHHQARKVPA
ncbi:hypothetical protein [Prauserella muralis]|uniref:Uncharacterized protein n=1 Tax=Prauserella muralis TaxID=588067 RepID=A0A2V4AZP9_9PSEU|nr:hypothetical protein [Prauserella muralis]PXY27414.1 hypothetical protein BAY60_13345 [Prauserella muralis]TWE22888.1 hypothetical protein FHX69_4144 [Prauserella muralis]